MTDTFENSATSKTMSHVAYQVRDRKGRKSLWTPIGRVLRHADDKGFTVYVAALPLDGRITLRVVSEKKD